MDERVKREILSDLKVINVSLIFAIGMTILTIGVLGVYLYIVGG